MLKHSYLAIGLLLLFLTNTYYTYEESMILGLVDSYNYYEIFQFSPSFPDIDLAFHHAQRFFLPYILGIISKNTLIFNIANILIIILCTIIFHMIINSIGCNKRIKILLTALLLFNPFYFRFYLAIPLMVNDLLFSLGLIIVLYSIVLRKMIFIFIGLSIAALGRQTTILLLPSLIVYFTFLPHINAKRKICLCIASILTVLAIYFSTSVLIKSFAGTSHNTAHMLGLFTWIMNNFNLYELLYFIGISIVPMLIGLLGIFLFTTILIKRKLFNLTHATILLIFAGICSQPILAGPSISGPNTIRLCLLSLPAILVLLGLFLKALEINISNKSYFVIITLIFLRSFHHGWSITSGLYTKNVFILIYLTISLYICSFFFKNYNEQLNQKKNL